MSTTHPQSKALLSSLQSKSLPPNPSWLQTFLSSQSTTSLPSLTSSALFRILASDITRTLSRSLTPALPADIGRPDNISRTLDRDVLVQILDAVDIGRSLGTQIEECEMIGRGEARGSGRGVVVRAVAPAEGDDDGDATGPAGGAAGGNAKGVWKFLVQDVNSVLVWVFDGEGVLTMIVQGSQQVGPGPGPGSGGGSGSQNSVTIGTKMLLRKGSIVARGVVLLEPDGINVLGGRIEGMEKGWREGRLERLKGMLPQSERR